ncbi:glycosyltransferase [Mesorhizobium sp. M1396]|uniref:glycosyltransferase n=1 Tax=Mesorhizobium sp. M1396 TaxID=2957095 RepID=UPI00333E001E
MLSVLIETCNDEEGLTRTLASLIGGAVEGMVRDVIVCDTGSTDQTHRVAEHAGCQYVTGGIAVGIRQAKGDWLLLLEPGARLMEGWIDAVVDHTARQTTAARFSRARGSRTPFLARVFSPNRALADGLLISKRQAAAKSAVSAEAIARGLATKRLDAEIWVAPAKQERRPPR